ncbi:MAG TPA: protein-methionine-sulfoxide reductase heme-binding subunit MsrQ [Chloroflexota bacterium]|nr:protein-methionine-sulfoxide reductase heme-binding subunit MsrQ [Chloroflexota bacterium]
MASTQQSVFDLIPVAGVFRRTRRREPNPWLKSGIFLGSLAPLAAVLWRAMAGQLGANPIAEVENELGLTALIFLVASLACTPAKRLFGWTWQMRVRREIGLFAFFYASLHFLTYLVLDEFFDWRAIVEDVVQRPFITVGFGALVLMAPLAITSTNAWVRRLGYRRWARIHQLIYLAGGLAVLHFIWRVKLDVSQPLAYAVVVGALLAVRAVFWARRSLAPRSTAAKNQPARARSG